MICVFYKRKKYFKKFNVFFESQIAKKTKKKLESRVAEMGSK